jgi:hypothetical protein
MPEDLVLNTVAINYIGNIDNEFVDSFTEKIAVSRFCSFVEQGRETVKTDKNFAFHRVSHFGDSSYTPLTTNSIRSSDLVEAPPETYGIGQKLRILAADSFAWIKVIGVKFVGFMLAFVFLFAHEKQLCHAVPLLQVSLMCMGIHDDGN